MKVQFELTDTFGGEANYGWVRRDTMAVPEGTSEFLLMRLAREWAGWRGVNGHMLPVEVDYHRDSAGTIALRPKGMLQVLFITFDYETPVVEAGPAVRQALRDMVDFFGGPVVGQRAELVRAAEQALAAPYDALHLHDVLAWARATVATGRTVQEVKVAKAILETAKE